MEAVVRLLEITRTNSRLGEGEYNMRIVKASHQLVQSFNY